MQVLLNNSQHCVSNSFFRKSSEEKSILMFFIFLFVFVLVLFVCLFICLFSRVIKGEAEALFA